MLTTLVKIGAHDCPICAGLSPSDELLAEDNGMYYRYVELEELASTESAMRDYVVPMYVTPNDGNIDLPLYLIVHGGLIQASMLVKDVSELKNLFTAWELYKKSQS